jgi:hypothetical protein
MVQEIGGFGENHRSLSNIPTQNPVDEPRYVNTMTIKKANIAIFICE